MFVVLRKGVVASAVLYASSQLHAKSLLALWSAVVFGLALYGSLTTTVIGLPGKDPRTGRIPIYRVAVFFPYYFAVACLLAVSRIFASSSGFKPMTELTAGIFVGEYFSSFQAPWKWGSIVDITNELPRMGESDEYLNIQSWDGCPPTIDNIQRAV